jgi:Flp pilus assembly protein TadD
MRKAYEAIYQGDFESAIGWFQRAVERDPDNAAYHYKGSITIARSGRLPLALAFARRAVELDPHEQAYAYHLRVLEAMQLTSAAEKLLIADPPRPADALDMLRDAAERDPLSAETRLLQAIAYRQIGDDDRAAASVREALALKPDWSDASRLLQDIRAAGRLTVNPDKNTTESS